LKKESRKMFWYGAWAWGLGSLLFWVLIAMAIFAVVRSFGRGGQQPPRQSYAGGERPYGQPGSPSGYATSPEQILAERFARGEIDEDEFHQRMAALRAQPPVSGPTATVV
jgi:putative membrane protein